MARTAGGGYTGYGTDPECPNGHPWTEDSYYVIVDKRRSTQTAKCKQCRLDANRARREKLIEDLGGACVCCGESTYEFLQIDHKNGTGGKRRQALGRKSLDAHELRKHIEELQVMCGSCHQAKSAWGKCPHDFKLIDWL